MDVNRINRVWDYKRVKWITSEIYRGGILGKRKSNIRAIRNDLGISQQVLAEKTGINRSYLSAIENLHRLL